MGTGLTIFFALLIVLVIADGVRRTWKARRDRLYESPSLKKSLKNPIIIEDEKEEVPSYISELPNGGARVVGHRDPKDIPSSKHPNLASREQKDKQQHENFAHRSPEQTRLNLTETVPILMQPADVKSNAEINEKKYQRIEPTISSNVINDSDDESTSSKILSNDASPKETLKERLSRQDSSITKDDSVKNTDDDVDDKYDEALDEDADDHLDEDDYDEDDYEEDAYEEDDGEEADYSDDEDIDDEDLDDWNDNEDDQVLNEDESELDEEFDEDQLDDSEIDEAESISIEPAKPSLVEPEEVIVINVMAQRAQVFDGNELLDIVLKCGLRYGSMNIFHRYSGNKGDGILLFSMANIVKPGTFDLDAMDEFTTLGVSLFLTLPLEADSLQSFELMLETAQAISQTLDGELKDEYRSVMTKQTIEHYRQRIRDFERKKLFRRPQ